MTNEQKKLIESYIRLQVKKRLKEANDPNEHIIQSFTEWLLDHAKSMKIAPRQVASVVSKFLKSTYKF